MNRRQFILSGALLPLSSAAISKDLKSYPLKQSSEKNSFYFSSDNSFPFIDSKGNWHIIDDISDIVSVYTFKDRKGTFIILKVLEGHTCAYHTEEDFLGLLDRIGKGNATIVHNSIADIWYNDQYNSWTMQKYYGKLS